MSTIISLVVVAVCLLATTWLVVRDGGQPATDAPDDHRGDGDDRPRPADPVRPATTVLDADLVPDTVELEELEPELLELAETRPDPTDEPEPEADLGPAADDVAPTTEPDDPPVRSQARSAEHDRRPGEVGAAAAAPAEHVRAAAMAPTGEPLARGDRVRAPERVRARRRDHRLRRRDPAEVELVAPTEVPAPQPAHVGAGQRLRSAVGLAAMLVVAGITAALLLGVVVYVVSGLLEDAVQ